MKNLLCLLFLFCGFSWLSRADVLHVTEHEFIVQNTMQTEKPINKVWQALIKDVDVS